MSEYIREMDGTAVISTRHALQRMLQRKDSMTDGQVTDFMDRVLRHYSENKKEFISAPYNSEYFFFSAHYQRGMIMAFRRDSKGHKDGFHFILVTIYPYGKNLPMQEDTPVIYI